MRGILTRCLLALILLYTLLQITFAQQTALVTLVNSPSLTAFVRSSVRINVQLQYNAGTHRIVLPIFATFETVSIAETASSSFTNCDSPVSTEYHTYFKAIFPNCPALPAQQYTLQFTEFMLTEPGLYPSNYIGILNGDVYHPLAAPFVVRSNTAIDIVANTDPMTMDDIDSYTTVSFTMSPTISSYIGGVKLTLPRVVTYQGSGDLSDIASQVTFVNNAGTTCSPTVTAFNLTGDSTMPLTIEDNVFFSFNEACSFTCATGCSVRLPTQFQPPEHGHVHPGYFTIFPKTSSIFTPHNPSVSVPLVYSLANNPASKRERPFFHIPEDLTCQYNTVMQRDDGYILEVSFDHSAFFTHAAVIEVFLPLNITHANEIYVKDHDTHYTITEDIFDHRKRFTITYTSQPSVEASLARIVLNGIHYCPDVGADVNIDVRVYTTTRQLLATFRGDIEPYPAELELVCRTMQVYQNTWLDGYNIGMKCDLDTSALVQRQGYSYQLRLCSGIAVFAPQSIIFPTGSGLSAGAVTIAESDRCATIPVDINHDIFPVLDKNTQILSLGQATSFTFNITARQSITKYFNSQSLSIRAQWARQYKPVEAVTGVDPPIAVYRITAESNAAHLSPPLQSRGIFGASKWINTGDTNSKVAFNMSLPFILDANTHSFQMKFADMNYLRISMDCGAGASSQEFIRNCVSVPTPPSNVTVNVEGINLWSHLSGPERPPSGGLVFLGVHIMSISGDSDIISGVPISSTRTPTFIDYTRSGVSLRPVSHTPTTGLAIRPKLFSVDFTNLPSSAVLYVDSSYSFNAYLSPAVTDGPFTLDALKPTLKLHPDHPADCITTPTLDAQRYNISFSFTNGCGSVPLQYLHISITASPRAGVEHAFRGDLRRLTRDSMSNYINILSSYWAGVPVPEVSMLNVNNVEMTRASPTEYVYVISPTYNTDRGLKAADTAHITVATGWSTSLSMPAVTTEKTTTTIVTPAVVCSELDPIPDGCVDSPAVTADTSTISPLEAKYWGKDTSGRVVVVLGAGNSVNPEIKYRFSVPVWGTADAQVSGTQSVTVFDSLFRQYIDTSSVAPVSGRIGHMTEKYPILGISNSQLGVTPASTAIGTTILRFRSTLYVQTSQFAVKAPHVIAPTASTVVTFHSPAPCRGYTIAPTFVPATNVLSFPVGCLLIPGDIIAFSISHIDLTLKQVIGPLQWSVTVSNTLSTPLVLLDDVLPDNRLVSEELTCAAKRHEPYHNPSILTGKRGAQLLIEMTSPSLWRAPVTALRIDLPEYATIISPSVGELIGTLDAFSTAPTPDPAKPDVMLPAGSLLMRQSCYSVAIGETDGVTIVSTNIVTCYLTRLPVDARIVITLDHIQFSDSYVRKFPVNRLHSGQVPKLSFIDQKDINIYGPNDVTVYSANCDVSSATRAKPDMIMGVDAATNTHYYQVTAPILPTSPSGSGTLVVSIVKTPAPVFMPSGAIATVTIFANNVEKATFTSSTLAKTLENSDIDELRVDTASQTIVYEFSITDTTVLTSATHIRVKLNNFHAPIAAHSFDWRVNFVLRLDVSTTLVFPGYPALVSTPYIISPIPDGTITPKQVEMLSLSSSIKSANTMHMPMLTNYSMVHYHSGNQLIFVDYNYGNNVATSRDLRLANGNDILRFNSPNAMFSYTTPCTTDVLSVVTPRSLFPFFLCHNDPRVYGFKKRTSNINWASHPTFSPNGYTHNGVTYPAWSLHSLDLSKVHADFNHLAGMVYTPSKTHDYVLIVVARSGRIASLVWDAYYGTITLLETYLGAVINTAVGGGSVGNNYNNNRVETVQLFNDGKQLLLTTRFHVYITVRLHSLASIPESTNSFDYYATLATISTYNTNSATITMTRVDPVAPLFYIFTSAGHIAMYRWSIPTITDNNGVAPVLNPSFVTSINPYNVAPQHAVITSFGRVMYVFERTSGAVVGMITITKPVEGTITPKMTLGPTYSELFLPSTQFPTANLQDLDIGTVSCDLAGYLLMVYSKSASGRGFYLYNLAFAASNTNIVTMYNNVPILSYQVGHAPITMTFLFSHPIAITSNTMIDITLPAGYTPTVPSSSNYGITLQPAIPSTAMTLSYDRLTLPSSNRLRLQIRFSPQDIAVYHLTNTAITISGLVPPASCPPSDDENDVYHRAAIRMFSAVPDSRLTLVAQYKFTKEQKNLCSLPTMPFRLNYLTRSSHRSGVISIYTWSISYSTADRAVLQFPPSVQFADVTTINAVYGEGNMVVTSIDVFSGIKLRMSDGFVNPIRTIIYSGRFINNPNSSDFSPFQVKLSTENESISYYFTFPGNFVDNDYIGPITAITDARGDTNGNRLTRSITPVPYGYLKDNQNFAYLRDSSTSMSLVTPLVAGTPREFSHSFSLLTHDRNMTVFYGITPAMVLHRVNRYTQSSYPLYISSASDSEYHLDNLIATPSASTSLLTILPSYITKDATVTAIHVNPQVRSLREEDIRTYLPNTYVASIFVGFDNGYLVEIPLDSTGMPRKTVTPTIHQKFNSGVRNITSFMDVIPNSGELLKPTLLGGIVVILTDHSLLFAPFTSITYTPTDPLTLYKWSSIQYHQHTTRLSLTSLAFKRGSETFTTPTGEKQPIKVMYALTSNGYLVRYHINPSAEVKILLHAMTRQPFASPLISLTVNPAGTLAFAGADNGCIVPFTLGPTFPSLITATTPAPTFGVGLQISQVYTSNTTNFCPTTFTGFRVYPYCSDDGQYVHIFAARNVGAAVPTARTARIALTARMEPAAVQWGIPNPKTGGPRPNTTDLTLTWPKRPVNWLAVLGQGNKAFEVHLGKNMVLHNIDITSETTLRQQSGTPISVETLNFPSEYNFNCFPSNNKQNTIRCNVFMSLPDGDVTPSAADPHVLIIRNIIPPGFVQLHSYVDMDINHDSAVIASSHHYTYGGRLSYITLRQTEAPTLTFESISTGMVSLEFIITPNFAAVKEVVISSSGCSFSSTASGTFTRSWTYFIDATNNAYVPLYATCEARGVPADIRITPQTYTDVIAPLQLELDVIERISVSAQFNNMDTTPSVTTFQHYPIKVEMTDPAVTAIQTITLSLTLSEEYRNVCYLRDRENGPNQHNTTATFPQNQRSITAAYLYCSATISSVGKVTVQSTSTSLIRTREAVLLVPAPIGSLTLLETAPYAEFDIGDVRSFTVSLSPAPVNKKLRVKETSPLQACEFAYDGVNYSTVVEIPANTQSVSFSMKCKRVVYGNTFIVSSTTGDYTPVTSSEFKVYGKISFARSSGALASQQISAKQAHNLLVQFNPPVSIFTSVRIALPTTAALCKFGLSADGPFTTGIVSLTVEADTAVLDSLFFYCESTLPITTPHALSITLIDGDPYRPSTITFFVPGVLHIDMADGTSLANRDFTLYDTYRLAVTAIPYPTTPVTVLVTTANIATCVFRLVTADPADAWTNTLSIPFEPPITPDPIPDPVDPDAGTPDPDPIPDPYQITASAADVAATPTALSLITTDSVYFDMKCSKTAQPDVISVRTADDSMRSTSVPFNVLINTYLTLEDFGVIPHLIYPNDIIQIRLNVAPVMPTLVNFTLSWLNNAGDCKFSTNKMNFDLTSTSTATLRARDTVTGLYIKCNTFITNTIGNAIKVADTHTDIYMRTFTPYKINSVHRLHVAPVEDDVEAHKVGLLPTSWAYRSVQELGISFFYSHPLASTVTLTFTDSPTECVLTYDPVDIIVATFTSSITIEVPPNTTYITKIYAKCMNVDTSPTALIAKSNEDLYFTYISAPIYCKGIFELYSTRVSQPVGPRLPLVADDTKDSDESTFVRHHLRITPPALRNIEGSLKISGDASSCRLIVANQGDMSKNKAKFQDAATSTTLHIPKDTINYYFLFKCKANSYNRTVTVTFEPTDTELYPVYTTEVKRVGSMMYWIPNEQSGGIHPPFDFHLNAALTHSFNLYALSQVRDGGVYIELEIMDNTAECAIFYNGLINNPAPDINSADPAIAEKWSRTITAIHRPASSSSPYGSANIFGTNMLFIHCPRLSAYPNGELGPYIRISTIKDRNDGITYDIYNDATSYTSRFILAGMPLLSYATHTASSYPVAESAASGVRIVFAPTPVPTLTTTFIISVEQPGDEFGRCRLVTATTSTVIDEFGQSTPVTTYDTPAISYSIVMEPLGEAPLLFIACSSVSKSGTAVTVTAKRGGSLYNDFTLAAQPVTAAPKIYLLDTDVPLSSTSVLIATKIQTLHLNLHGPSLAQTSIFKINIMNNFGQCKFALSATGAATYASVTLTFNPGTTIASFYVLCEAITSGTNYGKFNVEYVSGGNYDLSQPDFLYQVSAVKCNTLDPSAYSNVASVSLSDGGYGEGALNSVATFTCLPGHEFQDQTPGKYLKVCEEAGWRGLDPVCLPITCVEWVKPAYVDVSAPIDAGAGEGNYRSRIEYTCVKGFFVYDPAQGNIPVPKYSVTCTETKAWSASLPCLPRDCGPLPQVPDGVASTYTDPTGYGMMKYGSVGWYQCRPDFTLVPAGAQAQCTETGWVDTPTNNMVITPFCKSQNCFKLTPSDPLVMFIEYSRDPSTNTNNEEIYLDETVATYTCAPGYHLPLPIDASPTDPPPLEYRSTCRDGAWSNNPPTCNRVKCPLINKALYTNLNTISYSYLDESGTPRFETRAQFQCQVGYDLLRPDGVTPHPGYQECGADKVWLGDPPLCVIHDCGVVTPPNAGYIDYATGTHGKYKYLSTLQYKCNIGFNFVGIVTRTCTATTWDPSTDPAVNFAECRPHYCGALPVISRGAGITYSDAGYGAMYLGSVATYACTSPYILGAGSTGTRTCTATGWSDSAPTCVAPQCGPITETTPAPNNLPRNAAPMSYIDGGFGTTAYNAQAIYKCKEGYAINDPNSRTRTCGANGWVGTVPSCLNINECNSISCSKQYGEGSMCYDLEGRYICSPYVYQNQLTISGENKEIPVQYPAIGPVVGKNVYMIDTYGRDTISFTVFNGKNLYGGYPLWRVRYAHPTIPQYGYECVILSQEETVTGYSRIRCNTQAGVGTGMVLRMNFCGLNDAAGDLPSNTDCKWTEVTAVHWTYVLHYPAPILTPSTLRSLSYADRTYGTANLVGRSFQGELVVMSGLNLAPVTDHIIIIGGVETVDPVWMNISYGPDGQEDMYHCEINRDLTTYTAVACTMQTISADIAVIPIDLRFKLTVGGQTVYSTDRFSYPMVPIISRVSGCVDVDNRTTMCPTSGAVTLTITGEGFLEPTSVYIGGNECTNVVRTNTLVTCTLPPGAGMNLDVMITSGSVYNENDYFVSYAPPSLDRIIVDETKCRYEISPEAKELISCERSGGYRITLIGSNFGKSDAIVVIGNTLCEDVQHSDATDRANAAHSNVTCVVPRGSQTRLDVALTQYFGETTTEKATLSYKGCQPGQYQRDVLCEPCPPGFFSQAEDARSCTPCASGTFAAEAGSLSCSSCGAGTYAPTGSSSCLACTRGRYSVISGESCVQCSMGTYAPTKGSQSCLACPIGSTSDVDYATCICNVNFYKDTSGKCAPCPKGGNCTVEGTTAYNIWPEKNFFPQLDSAESVQVLRFTLSLAGLSIPSIDSYSYSVLLMQLMEAMFNDDTLARDNFLAPVGYLTAKTNNNNGDSNDGGSGDGSDGDEDSEGVDTYLQQMLQKARDAAHAIYTRSVHTNTNTPTSTPSTSPSISPSNIAFTSASTQKAFNLRYNHIRRTFSLVSTSTPGLGWWSTALPSKYDPHHSTVFAFPYLRTFTEVDASLAATSTSTFTSSSTSTSVSTTIASPAFTPLDDATLVNFIFDIIALDGQTNADILAAFDAFLALLADPTSSLSQLLASLGATIDVVEVDQTYQRVAKEAFYECMNDACIGGTGMCAEGYTGAMCSICQENYGRVRTFHCEKCDSYGIEAAWLLYTITLGILICGSLSYLSVYETRTNIHLPKAAQRMSLTAFTRICISALQTIAIASRFDTVWPQPLGVIMDIFDNIGSFGVRLVELDCFMATTDFTMRPILVNSLVAVTLPFICILFSCLILVPFVLYQYLKDRAKYKRLQYIRVHLRAPEVLMRTEAPVEEDLGCWSRVKRWFFDGDDEFSRDGDDDGEEVDDAYERYKADQEAKTAETAKKIFDLDVRNARYVDTNGFRSNLYVPTEERNEYYKAIPGVVQRMAVLHVDRQKARRAEARKYGLKGSESGSDSDSEDVYLTTEKQTSNSQGKQLDGGKNGKQGRNSGNKSGFGSNVSFAKYDDHLGKKPKPLPPPPALPDMLPNDATTTTTPTTTTASTAAASGGSMPLRRRVYNTSAPSAKPVNTSTTSTAAKPVNPAIATTAGRAAATAATNGVIAASANTNASAATTTTTTPSTTATTTTTTPTTASATTTTTTATTPTSAAGATGVVSTDASLPKKRVVRKVIRVVKRRPLAKAGTTSETSTSNNSGSVSESEEEDHFIPVMLSPDVIIEQDPNAIEMMSLRTYAQEDENISDLLVPSDEVDAQLRAQRGELTPPQTPTKDKDKEESTDSEERDRIAEEYAEKAKIQKTLHVQRLAHDLRTPLQVTEEGKIVACTSPTLPTNINANTNSNDTGVGAGTQRVSHNGCYSDCKHPTDADMRLALQLEKSMSPLQYRQLQQDKRRFFIAQKAFYETKMQLVYNVVCVVVCVLFLLHPLLTRVAFLLFSCRRLGGVDTILLQVDMTIECYGSTHLTYMIAVGIPMIIFWVIGIPLVFLLILRKYQALILTKTSELDPKYRPLKLALEFAMGFLFRGLKTKYWYWFVVDMVAKIAFLACCMFFAGQTQVQLLMAAFVAFLCICVQTATRPYDNILYQIFSFAVLVCVFAIFFLASFYTAEEELFANGKDALTSIIILSIASLLLLFVIIIFRIIAKNKLSHELRVVCMNALSKNIDPTPVARAWLVNRQMQRLQQREAERARIYAKHRNIHGDDSTGGGDVNDNEESEDSMTYLRRQKMMYSMAKHSMDDDSDVDMDSLSRGGRGEKTGVTQTFINDWSYHEDEDDDDNHASVVNLD